MIIDSIEPMKILLYGYGAVGSAVYETMSRCHDMKVVDPCKTNLPVSDPSWNIAQAAAAIIAAPSPEGEGGRCDDSIVRSILNDIIEARNSEYIPVIIKSTIPPDQLSTITEDYPALGIVYNPEFLRQDYAKDDFKNQSYTILGTNDSVAGSIAEALYRRVFGDDFKIIQVDIETASMVKYTVNSFLAAKVSFFNQIEELFQKTNSAISYSDFAKIVGLDPRIGNSHTAVPGPDGFYGWGGYCFPKDTAAFVEFAKSKSIDLSIIRHIRQVNEVHRHRGKNNEHLMEEN